MDRALKERIIGAAVLVVFAVLIVPIFLNGPSKSGERIQENIVLPGQQGDGVPQKTIVLERDRKEPVPVASRQDKPVSNTAATVSHKPEPVANAKTAVANPAAVENAKTPVQVSSTGMWAVQLGSFSNQTNAERLAADLRKEGFAAFLSQLQTESGKLHRVRIGPQKDRASAESVATKLSKQGQKGQVVPHP